MPVFNHVSNRIALRYASGGSYSFNKLKLDASDNGLYALGNHLASLQNEQPTRIVKIVTRELV